MLSGRTPTAELPDVVKYHNQLSNASFTLYSLKQPHTVNFLNHIKLQQRKAGYGGVGRDRGAQHRALSVNKLVDGDL